MTRIKMTSEICYLVGTARLRCPRRVQRRSLGRERTVGWIFPPAERGRGRRQRDVPTLLGTALIGFNPKDSGTKNRKVGPNG
jgi:hypothetical protein